MPSPLHTVDAIAPACRLLLSGADSWYAAAAVWSCCINFLLHTADFPACMAPADKWRCFCFTFCNSCCCCWSILKRRKVVTAFWKSPHLLALVCTGQCCCCFSHSSCCCCVWSLLLSVPSRICFLVCCHWALAGLPLAMLVLSITADSAVPSHPTLSQWWSNVRFVTSLLNWRHTSITTGNSCWSTFLSHHLQSAMFLMIIHTSRCHLRNGRHGSMTYLLVYAKTQILAVWFYNHIPNNMETCKWFLKMVQPHNFLWAQKIQVRNHSHFITLADIIRNLSHYHGGHRKNYDWCYGASCPLLQFVAVYVLI